MDYSEVEEYTGEKNACDNCEHTFEQGEVITVNIGKGYIFCYSDAGGGCLIAYVFIVGETIVGIPMRFGGSSVIRPANPMPNYPNTPINQEKRKRFQWLRSLLDGW